MIARARQLALAGLLLLASLCAPAPSAAREYLQLFVTEPYLELHTGPGRGYPVFNVVPRDASVDVLFRRTDWFKVRTERGVEGWASQADMLKTVLADGTPFRFPLGDRAGFTSHTWEMGIFAGQYGAATLVYENLKAAVESVGGKMENIIKLNAFLTDIRAQLPIYREVRDKFVNVAAPPASTTLEVPKLAREGALLEVEAIAVLPAR